MSFGLCLSGGGVKGAAHIGVLKALEEEHIKIDYIGGASSGSIVSTLIAVGYTSDEIYSIFKKYCKNIKYISFKNIFRLMGGLIFYGKININGLNSSTEIEKLINKVCNKKGIYNISNIEMPLVIPSVDLFNGKILCFTSRNLKKYSDDNTIFIDDINIGKAVQSSCSYPIIFSPSKYENTELVDGGIRENVPWKEVKLLGANKILNVTFEEKLSENCCDNLVEVAERSISFLCKELSNYELEGADYILKIPCKKTGLLDMKMIDTLYHLGYTIAKKNMKSIKEKLSI